MRLKVTRAWTLLMIVLCAGVVAGARAVRAAEPPVGDNVDAPKGLTARIATGGKPLFAAARESKVVKVLVIVRPEPASDPDRRRVLLAIRHAVVAAMEADGLTGVTSVEAEGAGTPPDSTGGKLAAAPQLADVARLKEIAPCDAVMFAFYTRKQEKRTLRLVLMNEQRSLAAASVAIPRADVAEVVAAPLAQEEVDAAGARMKEALVKAVVPLREVAAKAKLKHVAVVVTSGRGDAERNASVAGVVALGLEECLAASESAGEAGGGDAAAAFDFSPSVRKLLSEGRKPGPLAPKDLKRLQSAAGASATSPAPDAILGVACGRQGGRNVVEFNLVDAKRSLWKSTATLDAWDVAEIPVIPLLNQSVLAFANEHLGEQVGNGECWTLAAEALKSAGARHAAGYTFGRELDEQEEALPGDVMQFTSVTIAGPGYTLSLGLPNHTAVVTKVSGPRTYEILHQNVGGSRKVQPGKLNLAEMKSGKVQIFRPVRP